MKKTLWLLACFGIFYTYGCRKPADDPAVFRNSFSCKINGVDWKPEGGSNATGGANMPNIEVGQFPWSNWISVSTLKEVRDSKNMNETLVFEGINLTIELEKSKIQKLSQSKGDYFYNYKIKCDNYYYPDSTINDRLSVIELDTIKRIVKGVFEFEATSFGCKEKLKITEVRWFSIAAQLSP